MFTRDDSAFPVLTFQTETDVAGPLNYLPARQPDSTMFRLWEVAGTAHADAYLVKHFPDDNGSWASDLVQVAAMTAPRSMPRLEINTSTSPPTYVKDSVGSGVAQCVMVSRMAPCLKEMPRSSRRSSPAIDTRRVTIFDDGGEDYNRRAGRRNYYKGDLATVGRVV